MRWVPRHPQRGKPDCAGCASPVEIWGKGADILVGSFHRFVILGLLVVSVFGCASFRAAQLYQSGTRALDRGDVAVAVRDLEAAQHLAPEASEIQNHLGLAYRADGRPADARIAFARAVELDCENTAAQRNLDASHRGALGLGH